MVIHPIVVEIFHIYFKRRDSTTSMPSLQPCQASVVIKEEKQSQNTEGDVVVEESKRVREAAKG